MGEHENEPWAALDAAEFARWRETHLAHPFEVPAAGAAGVLTWGVVGFFALLGAGAIATGGAQGAVLALLLLGPAGILVWLHRRASARAIRRFDRDGVLLGSGRRFPWHALLGVETHFVVTESGRRRLWRTEFQFRDAVGWIVPNRTRDLDAVLRFVDALPVPRRLRSRNR